MSTLATPARPRAKSPIGTKNEATERADPPAPVSGAPWGNAVGGVVVGAEEVMGALVVVTTEGEVVGGVVVGAEEVMGALVVVTTEGEVVDVVVVFRCDEVKGAVVVVTTEGEEVDVVVVVGAEEVMGPLVVVTTEGEVVDVVEVVEDVADVGVVDEAKRHVGWLSGLGPF